MPIERTTNPFSTRWVRPGALPYLFSDGFDAAAIVGRLRKNDWRGAIIGPHGSGKSTLLVALIPEIEKAGIEIRHVQLRAGDRRWTLSSKDLPKAGVLILDGFEQLTWWNRRGIMQTARRANCGLLITSHDERTAARVPVIYRAAGNLTTLENIVDHLPPCRDVISQTDIAAAFHPHRGNIRDTLFALYDLFEQRRSFPDRSRTAYSPARL